MPQILSPNHSWPRHPHKEWNLVLDDARAAGWSLRLLSGHSWGKLLCSTGQGREAGVCELVIFTTGRNPEQAAKLAALKVARCPHIRQA